MFPKQSTGGQEIQQVGRNEKFMVVTASFSSSAREVNATAELNEARRGFSFQTTGKVLDVRGKCMTYFYYPPTGNIQSETAFSQSSPLPLLLNDEHAVITQTWQHS